VLQTFSNWAIAETAAIGAAMAVTIHDVARQARVSVSTVSRAFTTPGMVREGTRSRVLSAAEALGYRPNRAAQSLITGRTGNLGVIVPDLGNPFFPAVLKGAQSRAREADHAVFLADTGEDPRLEADLIRAMAKQVDGVVLCSSRLAPSDLDEVVGLTSVVLLNRRVPGVPAVVMDSADGMRQAVEHLAALGHRRCAYLSGPRNSWSNRERRRGLRAAARAHGIDALELGPFAPHFEAGLQAADVALAAGVTAVLAFNDLMALGVLSRLADRGVRVPAELSVVGFDDIPMAAMCAPSLTTIAMPMEQSGRASVELLLDRLAAGPPRGPGRGRVDAGPDGRRQRLLGTQLIVRSSTAPPAAAAGPTPPRTSPTEGS
jgi:DNA-binding LacI/PurR family transcriptional regulator